jgi:ferrous iron transport protein B
LFLRRAGTVILGINILLWFLAFYPKHPEITRDFAAQRAALQASFAQTPLAATQTNDLASRTNQLRQLDASQESALVRGSFAGHAGRILEPVIAPLGFDWKMGIGILSSFAAREVFVSTMSIVYSVGKNEDEEARNRQLEEVLRAQTRQDGSPIYTPLTAITLMVFYVLALQCASTVAVVRRETNSWKWPLFQWAYMGALAWLLAFLTWQGGHLLGFK